MDDWNSLTKQWAVMRHAVLMEDEGRNHFIHAFDTRSGAENWIAGQVGQYFSPQDFYVDEGPPYVTKSEPG